MKDRLRQLDHAIYRLERAFVVVALLVMAVVVFLDVVHRSFSGETNRIVEVIASKAAFFRGEPIQPGSPAFETLELVVPPVAFSFFAWVAYFAIRTSSRHDPIPPRRAVGYAVAAVVVTWGVARLLVAMIPNGFIWAQPLALVLTLWVGFIGASMCTYENKHLRVEAVQRALPAKIRPYVFFVSGVLTSVFCLALMWLSMRYVVGNHQDYVQTEGQGGVVVGLGMPEYVAFLVLPLAFLTMAIRYGSRAIAALLGDYVEADMLANLVDEQLLEAPSPSEVPTETNGIPARGAGPALPSEIPTEAVVVRRHEPGHAATAPKAEPSAPSSGRSRSPRPSEVPTEVHPVARASKAASPSADNQEDRS